MTPATPFSPGTPIGPYDGYDRTPRTREFVTGTNIATRPRAHERISFETLKGLVDNYDVAKIAIRHRIASIRALDWKLISAEGYDGDVTDAIPVGMAALKRPDRKTLFKPWLAKYARDILSYDAGTLYRMRNRAGRCVGLKVIDGTLIAPLQDYWGDSPEPPAEAYVQYVNGLPWNWLTRDDLIYEPYDPKSDSIYGMAPLEDILLNANTDIRFQLYFLQRFTEGNIPEAFASAPESWSPDQIETFQEYWDTFMQGDQSRKHQIRWIPGGSSFAWSNEKDFTDTFSLFLMRKTCAAFSVVPTDLGFTENANLASGESQADVQHKVGDLPFAHHIQDILSSFLQDDLGLPLQFAFDLGEEQDDRLNQANADQVYIQNGVIGASEIREMRFGLPEPEGQQIPRFIYTARSGPVPLSALLAVAGPVDPENAAPDPHEPLPEKAFTEIQGVITNPAMLDAPLAGQEFGPAAIPPAPPMQQPGELVPAKPVAKEGDGGSAGITSETGIYGDPLIRDDDDEDGPEAKIAKEMAAFRRFERARRKSGEWRDFRFDAVEAGTARRLNAEGRETVAKAGDGSNPKVWPGWKLNGPAVAYWAPKVTAAVALPASQLNDLAAGYLAANPAPPPDAPPQKRERNAAAAAWLTAQGVAFPLGDVATGIVTDGYLIGAVSATSLVTGEPAAAAKPGDTAAAAEQLPAAGAAVPAGAPDSAAGDMNGAYLAAMGQSLTDSQDAGLTNADAGAALGSVLADTGLAAGIVLQQVVTASAAGAASCYGAQGIDEVDILNGPNPCSVCAALAAEGPHAPGLVPVHPRCECAEVPHRERG